MATKIGPKTVTQRDRSKSLVFCIDAANSRSYGGEPADNLFTDPNNFGGADWNIKAGTWAAYSDPGPHGNGCYSCTATDSDPYAFSNWRLTVGTGNVTFSCWVKGVGSTVGMGGRIKLNFGSGSGKAEGVSTTVAWTVPENWQKVSVTQNCTVAGTVSLGLEVPDSATAGQLMLVGDPQLEQSSASTPFTASSRSATTALKNISGVGAQGTSLEATTFETYGQQLYKPTTRNVLASFDKNQGHIGGAYWDFDGSDETINCGDIDALEIQYMTIAAWINPDATTADDYVISTKQAGGFSMGINIASMAANKISTRSWAASTYNNLAGTSDIPIGEWTYVVTTYDGSNFRIYVNGEQENSSAVAGTLDYTAGNLFIGAESGGAVPGGGYFNGKIATAMIWSVALTAKEIKDIYIAQKGRFGK